MEEWRRNIVARLRGEPGPCVNMNVGRNRCANASVTLDPHVYWCDWCALDARENL